jgi:hypothetical protein
MIAVLTEYRGAGQEQYDAVIRDLDLGGKGYKGSVFHVAGPMEGGWRIVDVWDSQAALDAFMHDKLLAALQKNGVPEPQVTVWPVHNTVTPTGPAQAAT